MLKKTKKFALLSLMLVGSSALASCGERSEPLVDETGKTYVSCWINEGNMFEDRKKDSVLKAIEEECGVNLQVTGATHNDSYYTTLNPIINTGKPADIVFIVPSGCEPYTNWVEQDMFYNYDELIAEKPGEYPNLERLFNSEQYKNIQYADSYGDGMHTMLPFITSKNGWTIYYRSDWLTKIGYYQVDDKGDPVYQKDEKGNDMIKDGQKMLAPRVPTTMDEFQDVIAKFTTGDPDGNRINDTFGLSPASKATWFSPLFHAFGCTTDYDIDDQGNVIHQYIQPEYKNFLSWASQMRANGYIDKQFNANTNNLDRDKFYQGKSGVLITNGESHVQWVVKGVENLWGKGSVCVGPAPVGTATCGKAECSGFSDWGGWWGGFSIMKECETPHACMKFLDYINSPEGNKLFHHGIEGVHYTEENGSIVPNIDARFDEPSETFKVIETETGANEPAGMHQLGAHFQAYLDFKDDGSYTFTPDNTSIPYQYRRYFDETVRLNTLTSSKLTNVTCWPSSYAEMMRDIEDELNTYSIQCIVGQKNTTSDYDAVMSKISGKWTKIQRMIKETAQDLGII